MKRSAFIKGTGALPISGLVPKNVDHEIIRIPHCRFAGDANAFKSFSAWDGFAEKFGSVDIPVYRSGPPSGSSVILLHEITGAGPQLFTFGKRLVEHGFQVFVPVLYGTPNKELSALDAAVRLCLYREFALFNTDRSSPAIQWVRRLGQAIVDSMGSAIAVIGLCLTGNFALAMLAERYRVIPVSSEPSLPFWNPSHPFRMGYKSSLGLSVQDVDGLRAHLRSGKRVALFRFDDDPYCPDQRIATLRSMCPDPDKQLAGNSKLSPPCRDAHAVFTDQFDDNSEARSVLESLVSFLKTEFAEM